MRYKLDYALCIRYRISRVITRLRAFDDCYRRWLHGPEMEFLFHRTSSEWHGWNKFVKRKVWQGRRGSNAQRSGLEADGNAYMPSPLHGPPAVIRTQK